MSLTADRDEGRWAVEIIDRLHNADDLIGKDANDIHRDDNNQHCFESTPSPHKSDDQNDDDEQIDPADGKRETSWNGLLKQHDGLLGLMMLGL